MKPDASLHNPDPAYMRELRERAGLTQRGVAAALGMSRRTVQYYEEAEDKKKKEHFADYRYQFALEALACA